MADLFDNQRAEAPPANRPLPDRLRPKTLDDIVGQDHLLGADAPLRRTIDSDRLTSMILWGPPGCGKTTLARILSMQTELHFEQLSAIFSGVKDLRRVFDEARLRKHNGQGTMLFVDEIHRFNKSQQDAFLPVVEDGTIVLIGATTENPSFELNAALLSRAQVFVMKRLDDEALELLLSRAETDAARPLPLDGDARAALKAMADGDGRYVLSMAEQVLAQGRTLDTEGLMQAVQRRAPLYDKGDEAHYNLVSALHKSVRGSDVDAALYWLARMLAGGEQPEFIARRMTRMAVEDIGLADPQALPQCVSAWEAYERLGSPEGELALAQAVIYLATAPKSNAAYTAYKKAVGAARKTGSVMPPRHILNAPTRLMKQEGYGEGYEYDHDTAEGFSGQDYFPDELTREQYYDPPERGFERQIRKRLAYWKKLRDQRKA
ncbi:MAG: replication-associated recombination protein A [Xanthomonadales bacterium]|nr:replication-associated recombination protein A [Gammaproteobacteria bacterium]NNL05761.1 replication-associated recombination protein A [Xanthomonadales bacterium]